MLIKDHIATIEACRFCFMCRHVCTMGILQGKESDTPRGKGLIAFKLLKGHVAYSDDLVETMYRCCLCGLCQTWCKAGCAPPAAVLAARGDIVSQGKAPERVRQIRENLQRTGNPFGLPPADRFKAIERRDVFREQAEVLYYVGCNAAYQQPEIANAFIKILHQAKANFSLLPEERSTGKTEWLLGYRDDARAAAEPLLQKIRATKCKVLVTTCSSPFDAFKNDYPAMGLDMSQIEVLHASQYLDRLVNQKRITLRKSCSSNMTLLDDTYLGRYHGIYDEPRRILGRLAKTKLCEMTWSRQLAYPCGEPGGMFHLLHPQLSAGLAERVLAQAKQSGAELLVVTCAATKTGLLAANREQMQVLDVVELVANALDERR